MRDDSPARLSTLYAAETVPVIERATVVSLWHERARRLGLSERERPDFSALSHRALGAIAERHRALRTTRST